MNFIIREKTEHVTGKLKKTLGELIIAKEKAEESDRLKTAFLHNISHEIRTPLNAIIGFSEFLNDPAYSTEDRKDFTKIIGNSSDQLLSIISDLINIATIESGQEKIQANDINVNVLCKFIYDQFVLKVQNKDIQFEYKTALPDSDAIISTDETKIIQILSNLVGNALKFTTNGFVRFGYNVKDNYLEFYVEDSGIGIPDELNEEIFV